MEVNFEKFTNKISFVISIPVSSNEFIRFSVSKSKIIVKNPTVTFFNYTDWKEFYLKNEINNLEINYSMPCSTNIPCYASESYFRVAEDAIDLLPLIRQMYLWDGVPEWLLFTHFASSTFLAHLQMSFCCDRLSRPSVRHSHRHLYPLEWTIEGAHIHKSWASGDMTWGGGGGWDRHVNRSVDELIKHRVEEDQEEVFLGVLKWHSRTQCFLSQLNWNTFRYFIAQCESQTSATHPTRISLLLCLSSPGANANLIAQLDCVDNCTVIVPLRLTFIINSNN